MFSFFAILMTLVAMAAGERSITWPDDSEECPEDGGVPKFDSAKLPFTDTQDSENAIYQWIAESTMCFFDFVNEQVTYDQLVAGAGITDDTLLCVDPTPQDDTDDTCNQMNSADMNADVTALRDYVDLRVQTYTLDKDSTTDYSFRITGSRALKIMNDITVVGFEVGTEMANDFSETYRFAADGTLLRKEIHTENELATALVNAGIAKYIYFAKAVDGFVDNNGNIPIGVGDTFTVVIDKRVAFFLFAFIVVAILTSMSCCVIVGVCKRAQKVVFPKYVPVSNIDSEQEAFNI